MCKDWLESTIMRNLGFMPKFFFLYQWKAVPGEILESVTKTLWANLHAGNLKVCQWGNITY